MGSGIISQSCAQQAIYHPQKTAVGNKLETFAARRLFIYLKAFFLVKKRLSPSCHVALWLLWSAAVISYFNLFHFI